MPTLTVTNPATGKVIATLPADDAASVDRKVRLARAAQPAWAALPLRQRISALVRFRGALVDQAETLAETLTAEMGKPIRQSRNELRGVLERIDFFLAKARRTLSSEVVLSREGPDGATLTEKITHEPLGVVACISAWNYPYFVGANVLIPALLTGNAVLYKPSEFAAQTGLAIAGLLHAAGVPADIFIPLVGGGDVGAALVEEPVDAVFFTGSYRTGRDIARALAGRLVKLQLELGGKDPVYVCADVTVAKAAASIADGAFYNAGQSCCAVERIYVERPVFDRFVAAFLAEVKSYQVGDPRSEATYLGPLARAAQREVMESQIADAVKKGARVLTGGRRIRGPGHFFEPTVLTGVNHTMSVMRDETFGPLIGLMPVAGDEEAIALMNDTPYGLTAGVYTPDQTRAERILAQVRTGTSYWNCCDRVSPRLPWSGRGHSGLGLTLSTYGIQAFTRPRAWHLSAI